MTCLCKSRAGEGDRVDKAKSLRPGAARPHQPRSRIKASLEYALLGLIAEQRMLSGYDLVKLFDLSMAHYWHAHHGQIYPTLERMRRHGWIRRRDVIQKRRPNKRLYTITLAGKRRLMNWLESPFEGLRLKYAPLLRCRFLGHLGADGARAKFEEERLGWAGILETYRAIERRFFPGNHAYDDANTMFTYFTLHRGIKMMEENIAWCDWAIARIEENASLFAKRALPNTSYRSSAVATGAVARNHSLFDSPPVPDLTPEASGCAVTGSVVR